MKEVNNILRILNETKNSFEKGDARKIKELSNQTINTASLTQDPDNIAVAVIVYSIGKILERGVCQKSPKWKASCKNIPLYLDIAIKGIENKNEKKYRNAFTKLRKLISGISGKMKYYIQDVFDKAQINKASKIYEHGVSMEQTSNLLGVTMFDLAQYAGGTKISDAPESKTISAKQRIKIAEEMFG